MSNIFKKATVGLLTVSILSGNIIGPMVTYAEGESKPAIENTIGKEEEINKESVFVLDIPDPKFRELIWRGLGRYFDPYAENPLSVGSQRRYNDFNIYAEDMKLLSQVKELNIGLNNVDSIEGIHFFINLENLIADGNRNLKKADLSKCFELKELRLHECGLEEVILPKNLEKVRLDSNKLKHIDLSNTRKLEWLVAFNNQLEELDLSGLDKLEVANLDKNNISNIEFKNNTSLRELLLKDNSISTIDLSDAVSLERLSLKNNKLSKLDLSNNNKLKVNTLDKLLDDQNVEIKVYKDLKSYFIKENEIDKDVYEVLFNRENTSLDGDKLRFKDINTLDYIYDTKASTSTYKEMNVKLIPEITYIEDNEDEVFEDKVLVNVKYSIYGSLVKEEKMWMDIGRRISQDIFLAIPEYNKSYMTLGRDHGLKVVDKDTKEIEVGMRERLRVDLEDLKDLLLLMDEEMTREEFKNYPKSKVDEFILNIENGRRIANKESFESHSAKMVESQTAYFTIMNSYFALEDEVEVEEELEVLEIKDKALRKEIWTRMNRESDPYIDIELSKNSIKRYDEYNIYNKDKSRLDIIGEINLTGSDVESLDGIENLYNIAKIIVDDTKKLKSVDLSKLEVLTHFYADSGALEEVKFGNIGLEHIKIRNNKLKELDFTGLDELLDVRAEGNQLTRVNTSKNDKLKFIFLDDNNLSTIDFSNNKSINGMGISNNKLAYLDLSDNKIVGHNMILPNGTVGGQKISANLIKVNSKFRLNLIDIMPKKYINNIVDVKNGSLSEDKSYIEYNSLKDIGYTIKTGLDHEVYGLMDVEIAGVEKVESVVDNSNNIVVSSKPEEVKKPEEEIKPEEKIIFDDLDGNFSWAKKEVIELAEKNIIKGKSDNAFVPQDKVTRAEFVTMIIRLLEMDGVEIDKTSSINFKDINESDWYFETIKKATSLNLVAGYNGEFNPNRELTREEGVKILVNLLKDKKIEDKKDLVSSLNDMDKISDWAVEDINLGLNLGIVKGFENSFNPKASLNRGEAAVLIYRIMNLK